MSIVRLNPWFEVNRGTAANNWTPPADVWETPSAYRIDLEIPAVRAEDVDVSVDDGVLIITGKRDRIALTEAEDQAHRLERRHGTFARRFRLPENADADGISAHIAEGVLALTVAKRAEARPRRIEVNAA